MASTTEITELHLKGTVTDYSGSPIEALKVVACEMILGNNTELSETTTGPDGIYNITYDTSLTFHGSDSFPNIFIRVYQDDVLIANSSSIAQINKDETLDIQIYPLEGKKPSEYNSMVNLLNQHLIGKDLNEFTNQDLLEILQTVNVDVAMAIDFVHAKRLKKILGLREDFLFALIREGLSPSANELLHTPGDTKKNALQKAVDMGVIEVDEEQKDSVFDSFISILDLLKVSYPFQGQLNPIKSHYKIGSAIKLLGISVVEQIGLFELWLDFVKSNDSNVFEREVRNLLTPLESGWFLSFWSGNDLDDILINFNKNQKYPLGKFWDIGEMSIEDWGLWFNEGLSSKSSFEIYQKGAELIKENSKLAPTSYLVNSLRNQKDHSLKEAIKWLRLNPAYDFRFISVDAYLSIHPETTNGFDFTILQVELQRLEKAFSQSQGNPLLVKTLIEKNYDDANNIKSKTREEFILQCKESQNELEFLDAKNIWLKSGFNEDSYETILDDSIFLNLYNFSIVYTVSGKVNSPSSQKLKGLKVVAFHSSENGEVRLGGAVTGSTGKYKIEYNLQAIIQLNDEQPNLLLRVYSTSKEQVLLAKSELVPNAKSSEKIDLLADPKFVIGETEFAMLVKNLPFDKDVSIDNHYNWAKEISNLIVSSPVNNELSNKGIDFWAELFYGMFRTGAVYDPVKLINLSDADQTNLIVAAVENQVIASGHSANIETTLQDLERLKTINFNINVVGEAAERANMGFALFLSNIKKTDQKAIYDQYINSFQPGSDKEIVLNQIINGNNKEAHLLQASWDFVKNFGYHLTERKKLSDLNINSIVDLMKLELNQLPALFENSLVGATDEEKISFIGGEQGWFFNFINDEIATQYFVASLSRKKEFKFNVAIKFLLEYPSFHLVIDFIDEFFEDKSYAINPSYHIIALKREMYVLQRVFNLAAKNPVLAEALLLSKLDSSEKIKRSTKGGLLKDLPQESIKRYVLLHYAPLLTVLNNWDLQKMEPYLFLNQSIYDDLVKRAVAQYNYLVNLIGYYNDLNNSTLDIPIDNKVLPQLKDLFGSLSYTNCEHSRSVLSPAAYLMDILNYLKEIEHSRDDNLNGLDQFFLRRSDIKNLELNNNNTYDTVPYIDLVNEILENAVTGTAFGNVESAGGIKVKGKLVNLINGTEEIVKDIKIVATIDDAKYGKIVATDFTIGESEFELLIDPVTIRKQSGEMFPEIFLRAYQNDRLVYHNPNPDISDIKSGFTQVILKIEEEALNEYDESTSHWLTGIIRNSKTNEPLKGLFIEIWDKDVKHNDFLGLTTTSINGEYRVRFDQSDYREHPIEEFPNIYYKIYAGSTLLFTTEKEKKRKNYIREKELHRDFEIDYYRHEMGESTSFGVSTIFSETVYPWQFPVDLGYKEIHSLIDTKSLKKNEIIDLLTPNVALKEEEQALNIFGISKFETNVLYGDSNFSTNNLHLYFGLTDQSWLNNKVKNIEEILDKTGLSIEQFNELLSTDFVNPKQKDIHLKSTNINDEPQVLASISITAGELDRLHRFVRLSRKTGWSFMELDQLIRTLQSKDINRNLMVKLWRAKLIQSELGIQVRELITLLNKIDPRPYSAIPSVYESMFLDPSVNNDVNKISEFEFDLQKNELKIDTKRFYGSDNQARKSSFLKTMNAFSISHEDLEYLIDQELKTDIINYSNLSKLHKIVVLCKSLDISFQNFSIFNRIIDINLNKGLTPKEVLDVIDTYKRFELSGFSLQEIEYLLTTNGLEEFTRSDSDITVILNKLVTELKQALNSIKEGQSAEELDILKENTTANVISQALEIDRSLIEPVLRTTPQNFSQSIMELIIRNEDFLIKEIIPKNFQIIYDGIRWVSKIKLLSDKLKITEAGYSQLTHMVTKLSFYDITELPVKNSVTSKFSKWLDLIDTFSFHKKYSNGEDKNTFNWLEEHVLDPIFHKSAQAKNKEWLLELSKSIQSYFGWDITQINFVLGKMGKYKLSFNSMDWLYLIDKISRLCSVSGYSVNELKNLRAIMINPAIDKENELELLIKSKMDINRWEELSTSWKEQKLELRRNVLRDYLLAYNDQFKDVNDIYSHYLIDSEMSVCNETSRIKQAISSVQLFVQRISLSLEDNLALSKDNQREWLWRKNYRVWESNRKIFLYPENWILPELRKNKTPFYEEFLDELQQSPVNDEAIDLLFVKYLNKLHDISNMEIAGIYNDHEENNYYVFARTREHPHHYFYAQMINGKYWTPWKSIQVDIQGDHLIPAKHNDRLILIWPQFSDKAKTVKSQSVSSDANDNYSIQNPMKLPEIELGYSVNENGRWSPKRISKVKLDGGVNLHPKIYHLDLSEGEEINISVSTTSLSQNNLESSSIGNFKLTWRGSVSKEQVNSSAEDLLPYNPGAILENNKLLQGTNNANLIENYRDKFGGKRTSQILQFPQGKSYHTVYGSFSDFRVSDPFIFEDDGHTFFVSAYSEQNIMRKYRFQLFYHPYTKLFVEVNNKYSIKGLLNPQSVNISTLDNATRKNMEALRRQLITNDNFKFSSEYNPSTIVNDLYPVEEVDYSASGIYNEYNWELFFHIPLTLALEFSKNKQFDKAQKWFHYIFDPTEPKDRAAMRRRKEGEFLRFWKIKPFYNFNGLSTVTDLLELLHKKDEILSESERKQKEDLIIQLELWEDNPFDPHVIGRFRIVSYMKMIVMKYLDNLISWGDHLFTMDSMESINEATQLYILANQILGKHPKGMDDPKKYTMNVDEVLNGSGSFSNSLADIEARFPIQSKVRPSFKESEEENTNVLDSFTHLYFCIPNNEKLHGYWDVVEDRLFKIRNCMNIEGAKRKLVLFQAPIDPSMLVKAAAHGIDLGTILNEPAVVMTPYRFTTMIQKANELVNQVKSLGNSLLAALEKQDGETISLIRAGQEVKVQDLMRMIKEKAVDEAIKNYDSLTYTRALVQSREIYYAARPYMNANEEKQLKKMEEANDAQTSSQKFEILAGYLNLLPNWSIGINGAFGSPSIVAQIGGPAFSAAAQATGRIYSMNASKYSNEASVASIQGGYDRRSDDWKFQADQAKTEQLQIKEQIDAASTRKEIAERDLEVHDIQIEHAKENEEFLMRKYTNKELYQWMIKEISRVYFQSYQLAYQQAKKAEKAYAHELGMEDPGFVDFGYWDSLKKGLMSAEKLEYDLKRLEMTYYDDNKRELELTKHISLAQFFPLELLRLKESGQCDFALSEVLFDMDHPGHYGRRIKSISLTIPCITGPYTNVNCELMLTRSQWRKTDDINPGNLEQYPWSENFEDARFHYELGASTTIATSSAQNDNGLFELNFRDERFLPFEGAGAISQWHMELPANFRQFNYDSISDVIIHIDYTAKKGSSELREAAELSLRQQLNQVADYFTETKGKLKAWLDLKNYFSDSYYQLLSNLQEATESETEIVINQNHFPTFIGNREIELQEIKLLVKCNNATMLEEIKVSVGLSDKNWPTPKKLELIDGEIYQATFKIKTDPFGNWKIKLSGNGLKTLDTESIKEMILFGDYIIK